jgi:hypothetical protein
MVRAFAREKRLTCDSCHKRIAPPLRPLKLRDLIWVRSLETHELGHVRKFNDASSDDDDESDCSEAPTEFEEERSFMFHDYDCLLSSSYDFKFLRWTSDERDWTMECRGWECDACDAKLENFNLSCVQIYPLPVIDG